MAYKQTTPLDMTGLEILNARLQNIAGAPSTPTVGQIWYDTSAGAFMFRAASTTVDLRARANHTGTQTAATISDFDGQVRTSRLDQMAAPTTSVGFGNQKITGLLNGTAASDAAAFGQIATAVSALRLNTISASADVALSGFKITGLANGTLATDAATYGQLQNAVNGTDWKASVRAATTANITLSGLQTIDGISVLAGERVLVKNQTIGSQNGIYVAASGAWTRATDADTGMLSASTSVFIEEGTSQADSQWRITTDGAIVVGTTATTWAQFGASTSYTNGTGLTLTGNTFAIDTATVVRKYAATIGDASATSIPVTHNLNTTDVTVGVFEVSTGAEVGCDKVRTSANVVTLGFAVAPTAGQFRVVIHA